jgi:hypothetical protein
MSKVSVHSKFDYVKYIIQHDKFRLVAFIIDSFILVIAICKWRDLTDQPSLIALFALILTDYVWQIYNVISHLIDILPKVNYEIAPTPIVTPNGKQKYILSENIKGKYVYIPDSSQYITPKDENGHFQAFLMNDEPISFSTKNTNSRSVEALIKASWPILQTFLNEKLYRTENFTNDKKLCMASELTCSGNKWRVNLRKGCYYNHYVTNGIYNHYLVDNKTGTQFWSPYNALHYPIMPLENSILSNHIGVSTILVTSDDVIYTHVQNSAVAFNRKKIVPSGSGSVDYSDLAGHTDFKQIIIHSAERELKEETMVDVDKLRQEGIQVNTRIIGFYRDLSRGGKPEFCCLTQIDQPSGELSYAPQEDEQYTALYSTVHIKEYFAGKEEISIDDYIISDTLKANLYFLQKALADK